MPAPLHKRIQPCKLDIESRSTTRDQADIGLEASHVPSQMAHPKQAKTQMRFLYYCARIYAWSDQVLFAFGSLVEEG